MPLIDNPCMRLVARFTRALARHRSALVGIADSLFAAIGADVFNISVCHKARLLHLTRTQQEGIFRCFGI